MMKNKSLLLFTLLASQVIWFSCTNNVEIPAIDCTGSDLAISVESQVNSDCGDPGSITVQATGGSGSYQVSADGVNFQSSLTIENLFAGGYTITVKDSDGCTATTSATIQAEAGSVSVSLETTDSSCGSNTGTITVVATGGIEPYSYSLNNGSSQSSNTFGGVSNGANRVTVTDSDGCEVSQSVTVSSGIKLSTDVMPIISANCAVTGCHNGSRSPDLRTSAGVIGNASRIQARTSAGTMPPVDREALSQTEIDRISCWVEDGAPDN